MNVESLKLHTSLGSTTAHVARPQAKADAAVILIHEWWGINDHMRDIAGRYANEGYLCVAPDLFRGRVAKDPKEAAALMQALDIKDGLETIQNAIDETERVYSVQRLGITGFCMGGTFALRSACEISRLSAAAPFYGDIPPEKILEKLKVPALFIAGNKDGWINPEKVNSLRQAATKHNLPVEIVTYEADHAFFNNTRPEVYNPEAAADAWKRVLGFFQKHLLQSAARSA
jgi:carboxymethylenebutenolidase